MKNKNDLTVTATNTAVFLKSGKEGLVIPVSELSHEKISQVLTEMGYVDEEPSLSADVQFAVDAKLARKPTLVSVTRDAPQHGQITLETANPRKKAIVRDAIAPADWDRVFSELKISADDYFTHLEWLKTNGLQHANAHLIHYSEPEELTIPVENEFGYPPTEGSEQLYSSIHIDESLDLTDLFEFSADELDLTKPLFEIDEETRKSILDLFEFHPKPKKSS